MTRAAFEAKITAKLGKELAQVRMERLWWASYRVSRRRCFWRDQDLKSAWTKEQLRMEYAKILDPLELEVYFGVAPKCPVTWWGQFTYWFWAVLLDNGESLYCPRCGVVLEGTD
jgi:hypothetical protein